MTRLAETMKAIKVMGTINDQGQLTKNSRVEVIVLIPEESEIDEDDTPDSEFFSQINGA
ncbi:hypothetical protein [Microseira wollei]|uniref:Uncharacterized protein n=1 Tax=Microseira wollei NIES-4236 TaxID=2530354 RepID=A0AAV3XRS4_9CYAN|nr:hypothetical protein [Microseira wollei]GET43980.1 hypothetical protein MiSe_88060 [Microseira wollei NIES-4236]